MKKGLYKWNNIKDGPPNNTRNVLCWAKDLRNTHLEFPIILWFNYRNEKWINPMGDYESGTNIFDTDKYSITHWKEIIYPDTNIHLFDLS